MEGLVAQHLRAWSEKQQIQSRGALSPRMSRLSENLLI